MVKLGEICEINPLTSPKLPNETKISFIPMEAVNQSTGQVKSRLADWGKYKTGFTKFQNGDILVAKITPCFQNNKIAIAEIPTKWGAGSTEFHTLRVHEQIDSSYLLHFLRQEKVLAAGELQLTGTGGQRRLPKTFLDNLRTPLPPLEEQRRIATLLSHSQLSIKAAREKHQATIALKNQTFSTFLKDLQSDHQLLSEVASIQSGITKGRKIKPEMDLIETPYLAVSNVKDGFLDLKKVSNIKATEAEIERYRLLNGDIVLTEGGDPDKLGRGTIWREEVPGSIHQNHIFRVRLPNDSAYTPEALMAIFGSRASRVYFFRSAKQTTGIASINKSQLSNLPIPILSSRLISQISEVSRNADEVIRGCALRVGLAEELHHSLATRAFAGEL